MINKLKNKIKEYLIKKFEVPNQKASLEQLKKMGFYPKTIYDIGAYVGDFALLCHNIWSDSTIVCFEGLNDKVKDLNKRFEKIEKIQVIEGLVGEKEEQVNFHESETASSCLEEHENQNFKVTKKLVKPLPAYIEEHSLPHPDFLKVDTQGYEWPILKGASSLLPEVEVILAELNFIDIHKDVKLADEVITFLARFDFVLYDIVEIHRRPYDNSIWQVDFIFVKRNSFLRKYKGWK